MLNAQVRAPGVPVLTDPFGLTFNDIKNVAGAYQHRNGKVLVVHSVKGAFVKDDAVRTGYTRTNMFMVTKQGLRRVCCDKGPDGDKNWLRLAAGSVTITI